MHDEPPTHRDGRWAGEYALAIGFAALVFALLPIVSDVIAGPAAAIAIVLGLVGVRWHHVGRTPKVAPAISGTVLGAIALFIVVLMLAGSLAGR